MWYVNNSQETLTFIICTCKRNKEKLIKNEMKSKPKRETQRWQVKNVNKRWNYVKREKLQKENLSFLYINSYIDT